MTQDVYFSASEWACWENKGGDVSAPQWPGHRKAIVCKWFLSSGQQIRSRKGRWTTSLLLASHWLEFCQIGELQERVRTGAGRATVHGPPRVRHDLRTGATAPLAAWSGWELSHPDQGPLDSCPSPEEAPIYRWRNWIFEKTNRLLFKGTLIIYRDV